MTLSLKRNAGACHMPVDMVLEYLLDNWQISKTKDGRKITNFVHLIMGPQEHCFTITTFCENTSSARSEISSI